MLVLFLLCAFKSGSDRFYLRKAEGFDARGKEVFFYFRPKNALSLTAFYFNLYLRKLFVLLVCLLPSAAVIMFLLRQIEKGGFSLEQSRILFAAAAVLFVTGIYYYIRFNGFFFLARYLFASGRYFNLRQLFAFSYGCIKNNKMKVLKKRLSFAGWFFLCIFLLPVSFVRSHYNRSMAELADELMSV